MTTNYEALSYMICTISYNQVQMSLKDQEATTFRTLKGILCYKDIPFGLKNAEATYERCKRFFKTCYTKR